MKCLELGEVRNIKIDNYEILVLDYDSELVKLRVEIARPYITREIVEKIHELAILVLNNVKLEDISRIRVCLGGGEREG